MTISPASGTRASWVYQLLDTSLSLPLDDGLDAVVACVLDRLAVMLPGCVVGVSLVAGGMNAPLRVMRGAMKEWLAESAHPSRLFPEAPFERTLALDCVPEGSTLHIASKDALVVTPGGELELLVRLGARVLSSGVSHTRQLQALRQQHEELQRLHAHVIQAEKLASLGQLVAGVVHELNNPLTSIMAYADYLQRKAEATHTDPGDMERLRRISEAAARMLTFSRDLVTYARPATGTPELVELHGIIRRALIFCEHELQRSSVTVVEDYEAALPPLRVVARQLTQVLVNLFVNAAHAMENGGRLALVARRTATHGVTLAVSDTGIGIPPADLERVFDPFFTTKPQGRGAGLGLSIVRDIVSAHGGTVTVTSEVGLGTTFTLTLPAGDQSDGGPLESPEAAPPIGNGDVLR